MSLSKEYESCSRLRAAAAEQGKKKGRIKRKAMQPPSCGCVLKLMNGHCTHIPYPAAAFVRLCVETLIVDLTYRVYLQPPPRGCVLKRIMLQFAARYNRQPPPRGCVLKLTTHRDQALMAALQPPSGGCVLKHRRPWTMPACVWQPPSGGCVLKQKRRIDRIAA